MLVVVCRDPHDECVVSITAAMGIAWSKGRGSGDEPVGSRPPGYGRHTTTTVGDSREGKGRGQGGQTARMTCLTMALGDDGGGGDLERLILFLSVDGCCSVLLLHMRV